MKVKIVRAFAPIVVMGALIGGGILISSCSPKITDINEFSFHTPTDNTLSVDGLSPKGISDKISNINIDDTYIVNGRSYRVNEISDYAFYHNQQLRKITLPKSIERIGDFAFSGLNAPNILNDNENNDIDSRVVDFDLSRCNNLSYIGEYAFHRCTVNHFYLPQNNQILENSGEDAFCGVRFWNDLDFTGFKNLKKFGEWEFYGCENGKVGKDGNRLSNRKVILPNATPEGCLFTWSDIDVVYWNAISPNADNPPQFNPDNVNVFLTSLRELHINIHADESVWQTWFEDNGGEPYGDIYYAHVIADINDDGSINKTPSFDTTFGSPFDENSMNETIESMVNDLETWPIIGTILKLILEDGGVYQNIYNQLVGPNGDPTETGVAWIDTLFPEYEGREKEGGHMFQCELFLIWDRYLRFTQPEL